MSAAPTITGARPIPGLTTKTVPLRRSSNAKLRCGDLADGVSPIRSPIRRSGPVGPGPIHRASLAVAVSTADVQLVFKGLLPTCAIFVGRREARAALSQ